MEEEKTWVDTMIKIFENDPLMKLPKATVFENAPRALSQLAIESKIDILKAVKEHCIIRDKEK